MGLEDQLEEREMLSAIFPEEITDLDNDPEGRQSFEILVALDAPAEDESGITRTLRLFLLLPLMIIYRQSTAELILRVTYPTAYPDAEPVLHVWQSPDSPKNPNLFSAEFPDDGPHLLSTLEATIQENAGTAMIYAIVLSLKETAENLISERILAVQSERAAQIEKAEEEENRKFKGTQVTRETFMAWRDKFMKEKAEEEERKKVEEAELEKKRRGPARDEGVMGKLTGKQLWERGLVGKLEEDDDEDGVDALAGVEKLKIDT
jgi:hypothetical protein